MSETTAPTGAASPTLSVSGNPTPEELAALVVVLSALGGGDESDAGTRRSAWADPAWRLVGPSTRIGGWRASALPR
ncbi:acyl-CoA carboxylase subunit epsilon [Humibacillus xanthopallidus]|uniref:Acyl-CoA carboxylase epsilon subunit-like protein n=1 Tax=Humibacillus xanthopallidus TaxID=412689 RepID=A0A543I016_9MICO|nr:acyl-CoA carboxylase subunit epsilon [Humibacillus xanthopallidus]TQM63929.1 acyl-CoA carboxylase epsilon subunit-like protein [Humibacillus xanthopallidus]